MDDIINIKCLGEKTLSSYLDERLSDTERKKIEEHIADCNVCLDMLLVAYEARKKRLNQAGSIEKIKKKRPELKWFFAGLFFLALSFIFRHYFLQFLAIAVILGFKWAMEGEGAKRVTMIFKGIPGKEKKFERKPPLDVSNIAGGDRYDEPE